MTRTRALLALALLLTLLASVTVGLALGQIARNDNISDQRLGCLRTSTRTVILANIFRADATANQVVASDSRQPAGTRHARGIEASLERRALLDLDETIDPHTIGQGRQIISRLQADRQAFSCTAAFPYTPLFP